MKSVIPAIITEGDQLYLNVLDDSRAGTYYDGDAWNVEMGTFHRFPLDREALKRLLKDAAESL